MLYICRASRLSFTEAWPAPEGLVHAVDERYAPCWLRADDLPASGQARFIEARPLRLLDCGLLAEPVRV